jgi:molybdate transport system ATP-binding protein
VSDKLAIDIELPLGGFDLALNCNLPLEGITAVFGPSGAGKTSLLRAIAGFETPARGHISLGARPLFDGAKKINLPAHKRGIGLVFQRPHLFSHLTTEGNLKFAQRVSARAKPPKGTIADTLDYAAVIRALGLGPLLNKPAGALSGGEAQRAALGRSLLAAPRLLLLDEPLSALDGASKDELLPLIRSLPERFNLPVIYVSHNLAEVGALADHILALDGGRKRGFGHALDQLPLLAGRRDSPNWQNASWYDAQIIAIDRALDCAHLQISERQSLTLPLSPDMEIGARRRICIHARDVSLALHPPKGLSIQNQLAAKVISLEQQGGDVCTGLSLLGGETLADLYALITASAAREMDLKAGQEITALIKSMSLPRRWH